MVAPSTQKALYLEKRFGDYVVGDFPVPKPGPGQVLVKVHSAGLNPADWKLKAWGIIYEKDSDYPVALGCDIAGEVDELGEGVTDFKLGDRVFTQAEFLKGHGGFQQYALAFASTLSKVPDNLSFDEAATIAGALTAPLIGLYREAPEGFNFKAPFTSDTQGIYQGTPIVILGGASSVGQNAIQLAKLSGLSPIITTASLSNTEHLKSLGATHVFDRKLSAKELKAQIRAVTETPIKHVFDAISTKSTQETGLAILDDGGSLALVLYPEITSTKDKTVFMVMGWPRKPDNLPLAEPFYHNIVKGFYEKGILKPNAVEVLPNGLHGIPDGLNRLQNDTVSRLKLVARPQENL